MRILERNGQVWVPSNPGSLEQRIVPERVPVQERMRRYFGRAITPELIEQILYAATQGYMRDLTDLTNETLAIDPHFASVTGKRFRAVMSIEPQVIPASGPELDPELAARVAQGVRSAITAIPRFRRAVQRLAWARCHGRAAQEIHWKFTPASRAQGGLQWTIESLGWVHPRRLSFGPEREMRVRDSLWQGYGFEPIGYDLREIPAKFIISLPQLFNEYPEREGFGPRALYWSFFKRFSWRERLVLLEIFGKPWRIIEWDTATQGITRQDDAVRAAQEEVDALGAQSSAVLPPGWKVKTDQPGEGAGQIHKETSEDADDQISKLVLGQTRTTDAEAGGIGSSADQVAQDSESLVIAADAFELSDDLTEQLARPLTVLNFGEDRAGYTPRIVLSYIQPPPRGERIDNTVKALSTGLPLKQEQVYESLGFEVPAEGDETVTGQTAAPAPPGMGGLFTAGSGTRPLAEIQRQLASLTRQLRILRERDSSRR